MDVTPDLERKREQIHECLVQFEARNLATSQPEYYQGKVRARCFTITTKGREHLSRMCQTVRSIVESIDKSA